VEHGVFFFSIPPNGNSEGNPFFSAK